MIHIISYIRYGLIERHRMLPVALLACVFVLLLLIFSIVLFMDHAQDISDSMVLFL